MEPTHELDRVADDYRAQGYVVTVRPGADQLPAFARDFSVELVGRRGPDGVLVAVRKNREAVAADADMPRFAEATAAESGWRFDLVVLEAEAPRAHARELREPSSADIARVLGRAAELSGRDYSDLAIVAAWSALEAAMRMRLRALGQPAGWGSAPRQMARELYSAGAIVRDELDLIESTAQLRNAIVHGFAPEPGPSAEPEVTPRRLGDLARRLLQDSQTALQAA